MADKKKSKKFRWKNKRLRIKYKMKEKNNHNHPRLVVYRSNSNIYAQLVDDLKNITLFSASSIDKNIIDSLSKVDSKVEQSTIVGKALAVKINNSKIDTIIFDRNGYKYHGRIKALADAVREAGVNF